MPLTVSTMQGDGQYNDFVNALIQMPDMYSASLSVQAQLAAAPAGGYTASVAAGNLQPGPALNTPLAAPVTVSGSVTLPALPGGGNLFLSVQADKVNGGAPVLVQSTTAAPVPTGNFIELWRQGPLTNASNVVPYANAYTVPEPAPGQP